MMKRFFQLLTLSAFTLLATPSFGQLSIGHCNTDSILVQMPEYSAAMEQLRQLEAQYNSEIEEMQTEIQTLAEDLQARASSMTPLMQQKRQADLQNMYQAMQSYAQQADRDLGTKEQELLTPVVQKLQDAVNAVGKAKGLNYILDSSRSRGVVIYKDGGNDISTDVKKELGIL